VIYDIGTVTVGAAADEAAVEIEMMLADTDLLDRYRMALLET